MQKDRHLKIELERDGGLRKRTHMGDQTYNIYNQK